MAGQRKLLRLGLWHFVHSKTGFGHGSVGFVGSFLIFRQIKRNDSTRQSFHGGRFHDWTTDKVPFGSTWKWTKRVRTKASSHDDGKTVGGPPEV